MKKNLKKTGKSGQTPKYKNPVKTVDENEVEDDELSMEEDLRKLEDENRRLRVGLRDAQRESTLFKELSSVIKQQPPFSTFAPYSFNNRKKEPITESAVLMLSDCHGDQEILGKRVQGLEEYNFDVACVRAQRIVETTITHLKENMKGYNFERLYIAGLGDYVNGDIHKATEHSKWKNALKNAMGMGELLAMMVTELSRHFPEIVLTSVSGNHGRRSHKKDYRGAQDNWDYMVACHAATRLRGLIDEKRLKVFFPDSWSMGLSIYDWNFVLNHGDDIRCFLPGSPVTVSGYKTKPIEDIKAGDKVICHDGKFRPVKETFEYDHDGEISVISALGLPKNTWEVTPNHEVLIVLSQKISEDYANTDPEWIPAGHVSKGDYLVIPTPKREEDSIVGSINTSSYRGELTKSHFNEKDIPEEINLDYKFGYILGQYLGDGSLYGKVEDRTGDNNFNTLEISYNSEEKSYWEEFSEYWASIFGYGVSLVNRKDLSVRCQRLHAHGQKAANLILDLCGRGSHDKKLHEDIMQWPVETLKGILIGYLRADGHTKRRAYHDRYETHSVGASTCSRQMGSQLYWIARLCGYTPSIKYRTRSGSKEAFISFYGDDARELGPKVQREYQAEDLSCSKYKMIKCEDYTLVPVVKAHRKHYKGKKYDFAVEEEHSYTVNCASVHNSWNSIPWYGIERKTRRLNAIGAVTGNVPNYYLFGHFHNMATQQNTTGETILNSSWMATDEYALNSLGAYSEPFQWLFGVHPQYGVTWRLPIKLRSNNWRKDESKTGRYSVTIFEEYEKGLE